ncbi:hypothetical protein ACT7DI_15700 [Bacillus paranthracis]
MCQKKKKESKDSNLTEQNYQLPLSNLNNKVKEEVKFNEFFNDSEEIRQIFEQRIIIESIIRQLYFNIFNEETKMPVLKIISLLIDEDVFFEKTFLSIKTGVFS